MTIETRNRIGNIEVIGAANFCNSELVPVTSFTELGSAWATSGLLVPSAFTDLSTVSDDAQRCRFGFVTRNSSTTTQSFVEARARIEVLANEDLQRVTAPFGYVYGDDQSAARFFPATGWYQAQTCSHARGALEVQAKLGALSFGWAYQLTNDPINPGTSASLIGSYESDPSGVKYPSGFTAIDTTGSQLIRFGWLVKRVTGTGILPAVIGGELEFGRI